MRGITSYTTPKAEKSMVLLTAAQGGGCGESTVGQEGSEPTARAEGGRASRAYGD